jgi:serine/threonine protein kinase
VTRYRLGKILGEGGMATVHEGWRRLADGTDQPVAIKRIKPEHGDSHDVRERFHREARVCIPMAHPNLVKVYDFDRNQDPRFLGKDELFIVMERINGLSLAQFGKQGRIPHASLRAIIMQALCGLAYLHQQQLIHRDISPTNILVSHTGEVKLVDFGLVEILRAPMTDAGFKGNPPYACPEQLRGRRMDPSADLYSLAAVVYELLADAPPFGRGSRTTIGDRQPADESWSVARLPDDAPADLRLVVDGLLQPWHARQLRSADEVADALQQYRQPVASDDELAALVKRHMPELPGTELPRWHGAPRPRVARARLLRRAVPAVLLLGSLAAGWTLHDKWARTASPDAAAPASRAEAAIPADPGARESCTVPPMGPWTEPAEAAQEAPASLAPRPPRPSPARSGHATAPDTRKIPIVEKTSLSVPPRRELRQ